jgi:hypothetical protein
LLNRFRGGLGGRLNGGLFSRFCRRLRRGLERRLLRRFCRRLKGGLGGLRFGLRRLDCSLRGRWFDLGGLDGALDRGRFRLRRRRGGLDGRLGRRFDGLRLCGYRPGPMGHRLPSSPGDDAQHENVKSRKPAHSQPPTANARADGAPQLARFFNLLSRRLTQN